MIAKKNILAVIFSILMISQTFGQEKDSLQKPFDVLGKKFYYQMGIGYNFSAGIGTFENLVQNRDGSYTRDFVPGSWGKGFDISFGLGAKINQTLGIEMEMGYVAGGKNNVDNQFYNASFSIPYLDKQKAASKANTFRINPKLLFEVPFEQVNAFYAKIGYMVGFGPAITSAEESIYFNNGQQAKGTYEWTYTGGIVSGSTLALGVRFNTQEDISFFMEVTGNNLHRTFKKRTMTEAIDNGQNTLSTRTTYSKETVYVDDAAFEVTPNPNRPSEYPSFRSNYSSTGFRIGFIKHF